MKNNNIFKVGDKILDSGQVYMISKIKKEKTLNGKKAKVIYYKPYFKSRTNALICSIPIKNLDKTYIRRPISKRQLRRVLSILSKTVNRKKQIKTTQLRERLRLNKAYKTARVLKRLWVDKNDKSTNFSRTRKEVFSLAMKRLIQEVALVDDTLLKEARRKIKNTLEKGAKNE
ncbi:hypothetical protein ISS85_00815 [Candidatus Microgenomates bacterium]|nr:hypothetical protein [Candidatus Microgenomates bacterium]